MGNDLLTDDSIGLRISEAFAECFKDIPSILVRGSSEAGLALLDLIVGFENLLLVDAIQTGRVPPGFLHRLEAGDPESLHIRSPHFLGIAEVFELGHALGLEMPRRLRIFAVEVQDPFTVSQSLTPPLEEALPGLISRMAAEAREFSTPEG